MSESDSKGESPSVDEKRANYERFSMTVLDGEGSGYVNVRNTSYSEGNHTYSVEVEDSEAVGCSCPHAVHRGAHCKHQVAVENSPLVVSSASCTTREVMTDGGHEDVVDMDDSERDVVEAFPETEEVDDTPL